MSTKKAKKPAPDYNKLTLKEIPVPAGTFSKTPEKPDSKLKAYVAVGFAPNCGGWKTALAGSDSHGSTVTAKDALKELEYNGNNDDMSDFLPASVHVFQIG